MSRPASTRKPRASSQARIAQILAAARALLAEQGMASLSIYSVAEHAGIRPPAVSARAGAHPDMPVERESIDDRRSLHEGEETIARQPLERVRHLVLADADIGRVDQLPIILDVGILDVDVAQAEVGLEYILPILVERAFDPEARGPRDDEERP